MTKEISIEEAYKVMQKASGIKAGDKVKVLRNFKNYEMGCGCNWQPEKESFIGKSYTVTQIKDTYIKLDSSPNYHLFPFFVLEVVESAKVIELRYFCEGKDVTNDISDETKQNLK